MMIRCVILDADYTLYTPEAERAYGEKFSMVAEETGEDVEAVRAAWAAAQENVAGSADPDDRFRKHVIADMLDRLDADPDQDLIDRIYDRFWDVVIEDLEPEGDIDYVVTALREAGVEVVAVATNEFPDALRRKLSAVMDDPDRFDMIVTPRDTGSMKPSASFYTSILGRSDIDAESAVMVGDSWENDLAPAQELGLTTVLVGDDDGDPDRRIDDIEELPGIVEAVNDGS